jgi:hypothetical protein
MVVGARTRANGPKVYRQTGLGYTLVSCSVAAGGGQMAAKPGANMPPTEDSLMNRITTRAWGLTPSFAQA